MVQKIPAAMLNADVATQAELDAEAVTRAAADTALAARATSLELAGRVLQVVNVQTGAVATGTTTIPLDDTIPQNTEGTEFMSLAITPRSATSKLKIDVIFHGGTSIAARMILGLFQDSTAGALAATQLFVDSTNGGGVLAMTHWMTAGTTSATTFKVRAGPNAAATLTFNGSAAARLFGGVAASSITITEIAA